MIFPNLLIRCTLMQLIMEGVHDEHSGYVSSHCTNIGGGMLTI